MEQKKYKPSLEELISEYKHLNEQIFENQLFNPGKTVILRQVSKLKDAYGDCGVYNGIKYVDNFDISNDVIVVRMLKSYRDYMFCRAILAHEMIHVYQFIKYGESDHNELFFNEFKNQIQEYQIPLSEKY